MGEVSDFQWWRRTKKSKSLIFQETKWKWKIRAFSECENQRPRMEKENDKQIPLKMAEWIHCPGDGWVLLKSEA